MDFSRLNRGRVTVGAIASLLLIVSILFLPWYSYDLNGIDKPLSDPDAGDDLESEYALYWKVARAFVRAIGNPAVMRELTRIGMQSRPLMEWVLRIMANLLRPDELGPAEAAYKMVAAMVAVAPDP